eukprot:COSAG01_NODE_5853_length_3992_cov_8.064475_4_plen_192_part_00
MTIACAQAPELASSAKGRKKGKGKVGCPVCFTPLSITLSAAKRDEKAAEGEDASKIGPASPRESLPPISLLSEEEEEEEEVDADELAKALAMSLEPSLSKTQTAGAAAGAAAAGGEEPAAAAAAAPRKKAVRMGRSTFLQRIDVTEFSTSSKLEALVAALSAVRTKSPDHKSIVFSQYHLRHISIMVRTLD